MTEERDELVIVVLAPAFKRMMMTLSTLHSHAEEELRDGRLIEPFADPAFRVENISYYLIRSSSLRNAAEAAAFEKWVRAEIELARLKALS